MIRLHSSLVVVVVAAVKGNSETLDRLPLMGPSGISNGKTVGSPPLHTNSVGEN
jgi:hypothetical protein